MCPGRAKSLLLLPVGRTNGHIRLLPARRTYFVLYFSFLVACVYDGAFPFEATASMSTPVLFPLLAFGAFYFEAMRLNENS